MRRPFFFSLAVVLGLAPFSTPFAATSDADLADQVLVKVPVVSGSANAMAARAAEQVQTALPGAKVNRTFAAVGWQLVTMPKGSGEAGRARLAARLGITVVANRRRHIAKVPNDASWSQQWDMAKISAPAAWDKTTGSAAVVVAVIDTGMALYHEDLAGELWVNTRETAGNSKDDDADGYVDDVNGLNAIEGNGNVFDDNGHGSHVSGIIGASGNNTKGIAGVNWNVKIMALKFMDANGDGVDSDAIACMDYAVTMKNRGVNLRAVNCSWGGSETNPALQDAIDRMGAAGILTVCSAGNGGADFVGDNNDVTPDYPSSFNSATIISVGSSSQSDGRSSFSNYGATTVDLAAPGDSILSTLPGGLYGYMSGTSMAAPHVTGAVALVAAANPNMSPADIKARLITTVDPATAWTGKCVSGGRLNLAKAVTGAIYSISGRLYRNWPDSGVTELVHASIALNGVVVGSSGINGNYSFANLGPGTYTVKATLPGFSFAQVNVTLPQPTGKTGAPNAVVNMEGKPTTSAYYTITGKALNLKGLPVAGVNIYFGAFPDQAVAVTDATGSYLIRSMVAGSYWLSAKSANVTWKPSLSPVVVPTTTGTAKPNGVVNFTQQIADSSAPIVKITAPANNAPLSSGSVTTTGSGTDVSGVASFSFTLTQNVSGSVKYWDWSNNIWTTNTGAVGIVKVLAATKAATAVWSFALPTLPAGSYALSAWGTDVVGNETKVGSQTVANFTVSAAASSAAQQVGVGTVPSADGS